MTPILGSYWKSGEGVTQAPGEGFPPLLGRMSYQILFPKYTGIMSDLSTYVTPRYHTPKKPKINVDRLSHYNRFLSSNEQLLILPKFRSHVFKNAQKVLSLKAINSVH